MLGLGLEVSLLQFYVNCKVCEVIDCLGAQNNRREGNSTPEQKIVKERCYIMVERLTRQPQIDD